MAFQMIPPRVSSSPPPLDSLPSVACTGDEDDDDEFGTFGSHNTFDITGLSDKLPPTPESSPSKVPKDADPGENNVTLGFDGVRKKDSSGHNVSRETETSCPPVDIRTSEEFSTSPRLSDINGELAGSSEIGDDGDDFGDFSFCTSNTTAGEMEASSFGGHRDGDETTETGGINSSQRCNVVLQVADSSPNTSVNSFSMIATPPPLDHVVDNVGIDDEFSRISPNPPPVVDDDDFGDFATCTFEVSETSSSAVVNASKECLTSSSNNVERDKSVISDGREDYVSEGKVSDAGHPCERDEDIGISSIALKVNEVDGSEVSEPFTREERLGSVENVEDSSSVVSDRTRNLERLNNVASDVEECESFNKAERTDVYNGGSDSEWGKDGSVHNFASSESSVGQDTSSECRLPGGEREEGVHQSFPGDSDVQSREAQNVGVAKSSSVSEQNHSNVESVSREDDVSACTKSKKSSSSSTNVRTEDASIVDEKKSTDSSDVSQKSTKDPDNVNSNTNEEDSESDLDFGDFNKAEEEDDLDFGDLREQVCSGTFGMGESAEGADDFGDFYVSDGTRTAPQVPVLNDDDDQEFGDFGTAAAVVEDANVFGDFAKVGAEDDFGNFDTAEFQVSEKGASHAATLEDDEFGDFGDFTSQQSAEKQFEDFTVSWNENSNVTSSKNTPVLRKLESLVLKWIPKEATTSLSSENQENHTVPTLFQSVEDDAFVWRQLENLESSAALTLSWPNTQAQTLYLSSVNVDARNILFGQKWSSSVPLFAQTLSFSPLTPAKPTENGGTLDGGNRGSVSPPILCSGISPKFNASFNKDENEVEIPSVNENAPEEQIPPAKFDWTSSGLTNPLEGPRLEREFLSEGEGKGAISRIKGPPTPSPLVQQILGSGLNSTPSAATPLQSLSSDIREVVEHLPKIGFMRSRVLMFPIRGDE